jgi:hypothetical protein
VFTTAPERLGLAEEDEPFSVHLKEPRKSATSTGAPRREDSTTASGRARLPIRHVASECFLLSLPP